MRPAVKSVRQIHSRPLQAALLVIIVYPARRPIREPHFVLLVMQDSTWTIAVRASPAHKDGQASMVSQIAPSAH